MDATKSLAATDKASVGFQDSEANILRQIDGEPQLWTFTTASWPLYTPIADFYYFDPNLAVANDSPKRSCRLRGVATRFYGPSEGLPGQRAWLCYQVAAVGV